MQSGYKLSIIIPHYNTPDLLAKLLSTIPDNKEIQIIVVDDNSSNEVKRELQKLKLFYDGREILFLENNSLEHNAGAARNIGLRNAGGEWLLFADADDYFLDGFYEIIERYFETDYDIVFFSFKSVELDTGNLNVRQGEYCDYIKSYLKNPNNLTEANLRYKWLAPWGKLIKKSLIDLNNITFDSIRVSNDVIFSIKTGFEAKKIAVSEGEIYCVTRHKGSLTTEFDLGTFEIRTEVNIRYFRFMRNHLSQEEFQAVEAYRIAWKALSAILRRGYGVKVLIKYFRIFWNNKMFIFDVRIFEHLNIKRWFEGRQKENELRKRYEK